MMSAHTIAYSLIIIAFQHNLDTKKTHLKPRLFAFLSVFFYKSKERIEMKLPFFLMMGVVISTTVPSFAAPLPPQSNTITKPRFNDLAQQCSRGVHPNTLQAVARVESKFNPYAIGVVKGSLKRQPTSLAEAVATAKSLHAKGKNFSMGLMQVNRYNLAAYGLNYETVFDPCKNINAGAKILKECFDRAGGNGQIALQKAFSCYYSGNFKFGFKSDFKGQPPYVTKIILAAMDNSPHQIIHYSRNLNVSNNHVVKPNNIQNVNYVPQPSTSNTSRQPETHIPMPANTQVEPETAVTSSDNQAVVAVAKVVPKPKQEWDIFQEF